MLTQQFHCLQDKLDLFGVLPSSASVLGYSLRQPIEILRDRFEQSIRIELSWTVQMDLEEELRYYLRCPLYTWQLLELFSKTQLSHIQLSHTQPPQTLLSWLAASISFDAWIEGMSCQDFCIEQLGCQHDAGLWLLLKNLVEACSWFVPYEKVCFVGDRIGELPQLTAQC